MSVWTKLTKEMNIRGSNIYECFLKLLFVTILLAGKFHCYHIHVDFTHSTGFLFSFVRVEDRTLNHLFKRFTNT